MFRSSRTWLLPAAMTALLANCGLVGKWLAPRPKQDKDAAGKDIFIGTVEMVNLDQRFVLIKTGMRFNLQPGWKLETRPVDGPKSILTVAPEQKLNFLSADIADGYPQRGQIVVLPPQPSAAPLPDTPSPTIPTGAPAAAPSTIYSLPPPIR